MEVHELSMLSITIIVAIGFLTAVLHGATGMAGGIVLTAVLSHVIGIKVAIPVVTCALLFSHASRVWLHFRHLDWSSVTRVILFSSPGILIGATLFSTLSPTLIAAVMAIFLSLSFPIKAWAKKNQLQTTNSVLAGVSVFWGMLAGNVVGPGFVLAPFLLGRGMSRITFVGSLAVIVLWMNLVKAATFGMTNLISSHVLLLGLLLGLITVPGNWLGKKVLVSMDDARHRQLIDIMTIMLIVNFVLLIFR